MDDLKLYSKSEREMESLLQTVRLCSEDMRMELGIGKCATFSTRRGKLQHSTGVHFANGKTIPGLGEGQGYKYLWILQDYNIKHDEMKAGQEGICRSSEEDTQIELNGGNTVTSKYSIVILDLVTAIKIWTAALARYMTIGRVCLWIGTRRNC